MSVEPRNLDLHYRYYDGIGYKRSITRNTMRSSRESGNFGSFYKRGRTQERMIQREKQDKHKKLNQKYEEKNEAVFTYSLMLSDERVYPVMRTYNPDTNYLEESINVYKFYFDELKHSFKQRMKTMHLAMAYFTQTIMRWPCLQRSEIGIIAASSFLWASKFDEIDYNLPSIKSLTHEMANSKYLKNYDCDFTQFNFISCEKEIWKRLDWNFHQMTPFHFLENLVNQDIFEDWVGSVSKRDGNSNSFIMNFTPTSNVDNVAAKTRTSRASSLCRRDSRHRINDNQIKAINTSFTNSIRAGSQYRNSVNDNSSRLLTEYKKSRRSSSRRNEERNTASYSIKLDKKATAIEISAYVLQLSCLLFETQKYPSSMIAAAWILWSRHILQIEPLWSQTWETKAKFTLSQIAECANTLLHNYNSLKIGFSTLRASEWVGKIPFSYDGSLIVEPREQKGKIDLQPESVECDEEDSITKIHLSPKLNKRKNTETYKTEHYRTNLTKRNSLRVEKYASVNNSINIDTQPEVLRKTTTYKPRTDNNKLMSSINSKEWNKKRSSIVEKASASFKRGINKFIENTGNILRQVKNDIAHQDDFSISNAFERYSKSANILLTKHRSQPKSTDLDKNIRECLK